MRFEGAGRSVFLTPAISICLQYYSTSSTKITQVAPTVKQMYLPTQDLTYILSKLGRPT